MVIDPHKSKEAYFNWKKATAHGIPGMSAVSSRFLKDYLADMEVGRNIGRGSKKGARSFIRLVTVKYKLVKLAKVIESRSIASIVAINERQAHDLFAAMRSGEIPRLDGGVYRSTGNFVKAFRAFWHWHMKVQRKRGVVLDDICVDLDSSTEKPPWVYLTHNDVQKLCNHAKHSYRVLMMFLFDTGIRSPTELVNVRVGDLQDDCSKLSIRDETSKTFGRTINLLLCSAFLRDHIREQNLGFDDQLFPINSTVVNRYFKRLAVRVFGDYTTRAGAPLSRLSLYDFRHSSACYWLARYKSESALKYRFGWKRSEMIHYYTEFLGMADSITDEDLVTAPDRSAIEQRLEQTEKEKQILEEELHAVQEQMSQILAEVHDLSRRIK